MLEGCKMTDTPHRRGLSSASQGVRIFLIGLAICGLTVSLATRTFRLSVPHGTTVSSGDAPAMRQHMDSDATHWVPPTPIFAVLEAPTSYPYVAPAGPPLASILFDKSLYNRPPPSS